MSGRTLCILGGPLETGNLGVAALGTSAVKGVRRAFPESRLLLQSWSRDRTVRVPHDGGHADVDALCLYSTDYLRYRFGTRHLRLHHAVVSILPRTLGRLAARLNRTLGQLLDSDAILDVAAGDSFADIYGEYRFGWQADIKLLARSLGRPLVLLPQTIGPFTTERSRELARQIIDYSALVATREVCGVRELEELFGGRLHQRVVCCPDMAFLLDPLPVAAGREPFVDCVDDRPLIGLNVSGMLYLSKRQFGLQLPYPELIDGIIEWALNQAGARVLLIPHVVSQGPLPDDLSRIDLTSDVSDTAACAVVLRAWQERGRGRVACLGGPYDAGETKYFLGKCDFFIGARMHACIGSLSQGVPTVTLAYSKKAAGTLGHVGVPETILDARSLNAAESLSRIRLLYDQRRDIAARLAESAPVVQAEAMRFFTEHLPRVLGTHAMC